MKFIIDAQLPRRLVFLLRNAELEAIFLPALPTIVTALTTHSYLELTRQALIIHV